jgi:hypothetical protein
MKAAAGADSITMEPYASRPMPSSRPSALGFPPQHLLPSCAPLAYPKTFAHAEPPVPPERHNPSSISSLRIDQARLLAARLPRCPWCGTDGRPAL